MGTLWAPGAPLGTVQPVVDHDRTMIRARAEQGNIYTPPPRVRTVPGTFEKSHRFSEYEGRLPNQPAYPLSAQHFGYDGSVRQRGEPLGRQVQKYSSQRLSAPKVRSPTPLLRLRCANRRVADPGVSI